MYTSETFQLTDIWTKYDFTFTALENAIGSFNIDMGGQTGSYHFDDLELNIPAAETDNQVSNADFSAGDSVWSINTYYPAVAQGIVIDGEYAVSITNGGNYLWDIHLGQTGFTIENGKEYNLSFDAYASAPREISPIVGKNSEPWTVYNNIENVLLSPYRKTYSYFFIMNETSDTEARLGFDVGLSSDDVFVDNVFLSNGTIPINVDEKNNSTISTFQLFQNFPNPFNPSTKISWQSPVGSWQTLKVFDVLGNEIATLVDEYKPLGMYNVQFTMNNLASGIYFYQLKAGEYIQTKKMILLR